MLCPNCKKEIENGSAFCEHCGARIKKSKKGLWITLSVIIVAVVTTIVVITIQEQQEQMAMEQYRVEQYQRKVEQQLQAERIAKEEAEREAELARQEAARNAELVRQEAARKAEAERQAELVRQEAARKAEAERQAELAHQEAARNAELARQEAALKAEGERKAELLKYVDLGLPSGILWKNVNEGGDNALYTKYEAARKFGSNLPTKAEFEEIKNSCRWSWTGRGYKVTGPNGNSIIFPAAGYLDGTDVYETGMRGFYCSSTLYDSGHAWHLSFISSVVEVYYGNRAYGGSVRLVKTK